MQTILRVSDVLRRPLFQGAVVVAGTSGLHHAVRWVHILDVPEALSHLHGGELVLSTGRGFGVNTVQFETFVNQLIDGGAAGLCIELGTVLREIPLEIAVKADHAHFPLLVFPNQVRFVDITQDLHKVILTQERQAFYEQDWVEQHIRGQAIDKASAANSTGSHAKKAFRTAVFAIPDAVNAPSFDMDPNAPGITADCYQWKSDLLIYIHSAFTRQSIRPYVSIRTDTIVFILEMTADRNQTNRYDEWIRRINNTFDTLKQVFSRMKWQSHLCMGVGCEISHLADARQSYTDALIALDVCKQVKGDGWLSYEETGIYRYITLLSEHPETELYAQNDLARVLAYDRDHHANLFETLKMYLDYDRSKQRTADALFIHRQTFYHRLEQLEQILQVDLDDPVQRLSLHLSIYYHWFLDKQEKANS